MSIVLFLGAGPAITDSVAFQDKYNIFSQYYTGDIITPVAGESYMNMKQAGAFKIHPFVYYYGNSLIRNVYNVLHTMIKAIYIYYRERKYEIVISPNPLTTGLMALLISKLTGAKCIIEVNGNFESAFKFGTKGEIEPGLGDQIKDWISKIMIVFVIKRTDMVKLVYKKQLKQLHIRGEIKINSFPNFVPIKRFIESPKTDNKYLLLLGYPWYLKGVDVLIKAFIKISPEFPTYRLKVVGWCPEGREFFEDLAKENPNIELCDPVYYEEVIPLMVGCSIYVLASRTDSSPRVLREAMASKKPIIAANIDGVPDLIKDGFNGLLFEKDNAEDLADKIRLVLTDEQMARTLAENGFKYVQDNLSEKCYIENYKKMIDLTLDPICYVESSKE
jgi:glycosyltransferase involved in cell wall biosynthesis